MDIEIKNIDTVINICEEILSYNNQAAENINSLDSTLQKVNSKWESSGQDKESYVTELEKQINNLNVLETEIKKIANSIKYYAQNARDTSNKTITG